MLEYRARHGGAPFPWHRPPAPGPDGGGAPQEAAPASAAQGEQGAAPGPLPGAPEGAGPWTGAPAGDPSLGSPFARGGVPGTPGAAGAAAEGAGGGTPGRGAATPGSARQGQRALMPGHAAGAAKMPRGLARGPEGVSPGYGESYRSPAGHRSTSSPSLPPTVGLGGRMHVLTSPLFQTKSEVDRNVVTLRGALGDAFRSDGPELATSFDALPPGAFGQPFSPGMLRSFHPHLTCHHLTSLDLT